MMNETKPTTLSDLQNTMDMLTIEWKKFRDICIRMFTPEKLATLEAEDPDERVNEEIDLDEEAVELMVREPKVEPEEDDLRDVARFARNTEPQDNILSGAVNSER
jgi:hypothetical protein